MLAFAMPSEFTRAQIEAIAALAHLEFDPSEVDVLARQLADILTYAEQVQQVDTAGVPPTSSIATSPSSDRPDQVCPSLDLSEVLANAPDPARELGLFKVPRVIG